MVDGVAVLWLCGLLLTWASVWTLGVTDCDTCAASALIYSTSIFTSSSCIHLALFNFSNKFLDKFYLLRGVQLFQVASDLSCAAAAQTNKDSICFPFTPLLPFTLFTCHLLSYCHLLAIFHAIKYQPMFSSFEQKYL